MESSATPRLAWKWILEKLVDLPDFGVSFFDAVISRHVPDIEELHCRPILERVALRNLEDMVVSNQIDVGAIPLMKALTEQVCGPGTTIGSSVKQRFNKELVLRIQTEVVLSVLRKDVGEGEIDWAFFEAELERVFGDAEEDNRLLDRKRELCALLKPKNQTKAIVASYFDKYALKKLRDDLCSFIEEKRESFTIMFLKKLSLDFFDANGKPFSEDLEKSTNVESNGKQDHVGQTSKVNETEDQHIVVGPTILSGNKRLRRKLLLTQDDDESDEAEEGSAWMKKPRNVSLSPIVKPLLHQGVSEPAVPACARRSGFLSMNQDVESPMNRVELPSSDLGNLVRRSCGPVAHERISVGVEKISPRKPSPTNRYVIISDVESDAETQVAKTLSTDDEDSVTVEGSGDKHEKKGAQSLPENEQPQTIVEAKVVREEATVVPTEQMKMVDRQEASRGSPKDKVSQREVHENLVSTKEFIQPDSQDTNVTDLLEIGSDGYENTCHTCGSGGELHHCHGCPISMHFGCIKGLGLSLPDNRKDWYCPVCLSKRAAQEAAEAEKAADVAKEKLNAFKMTSKKRFHVPDEDGSCPEKGVKQSRLKISSLESGENDRVLKPKQQSGDEPNEGQRDSDPSIESLLPTVLQKGFTQLNLRNPDHSSPVDNPQSRRPVSLGRAGSLRDGSVKLHKTQLSHDQEVSRRDQFAASTSRQSKRQRERFALPSKKNGTGVDSDEESGEQSGAGDPEPASGAGRHREMEGDEDDEDLHEARSECRIQGILFSGRQRVPGLRRRALPWTREEELALKEGVKRFSHNGSWGFQWKRILEFGQGRFDPTRTDVDLKDKWRNLVKGVS